METEIERLLMSTKRSHMNDLIWYLKEIGFFNASCSGGNHLCQEGGLAEHSLNVCNKALELWEAWKPKIPKESIIIASLLHDVGKCGDFGKVFYIENKLKSGNLSGSKPFKRNPAILEKNHAVKSVVQIERWIDLTEDEEFAILHHDGLYEISNKEAWTNPTELLMVIHFADLWSSRVIEKKGRQNDT